MSAACAVMCGCVAVAAPRGHGRAAAPAARGTRAEGATRQPAANTGIRGYSPPPPPVSPIRGLIDFHTHAAPDVFGRSVDDDELAALAAVRQMEGDKGPSASLAPSAARST